MSTANLTTITRPNVGTVYLIHFERPYQHAQHYLGWSMNVDNRLYEHRTGHGARLLQVVMEARITWHLVRMWPDADRSLERRLKNWKKPTRICPVCNPRCVQSDPMFSKPPVCRKHRKEA